MSTQNINDVPSSLPVPPEVGVFSVTLSKEINAPVEKVWTVLLDFPKYEEWNPFVRSMAITTATKEHVSGMDAEPMVGKYLLMETRIPPSFDSSRSRQPAFEVITAVEHDNHIAAWKNLDYPSWLLRAERWQVLTALPAPVGDDGATGGPVTRYETREVFAGLLAYLVKWLMKAKLEESFEAMARALKKRSEDR